MALLQLRMAGKFYNSNTAGIPFEEWSCSISLSQTGALDLPALNNAAATACIAWFEASDTGIDASCSLEEVALNQIDISTGLYLTDPTQHLEYSSGAHRGARTPTIRQVPFLSYKVSIDDGTRDRRHKGGFYVPRVALEPQADGRFSAGDVGNAVDSAQTFLNALSAMTGCNVVVWSRSDEALHGVTRVRVGDVPDYISRRKRQMDEMYTSAVLTP